MSKETANRADPGAPEPFSGKMLQEKGRGRAEYHKTEKGNPQKLRLLPVINCYYDNISPEKKSYNADKKMWYSENFFSFFSSLFFINRILKKSKRAVMRTIDSRSSGKSKNGSEYEEKK
jgi:hypothetical protein